MQTVARVIIYKVDSVLDFRDGTGYGKPVAGQAAHSVDDGSTNLRIITELIPAEFLKILVLLGHFLDTRHVDIIGSTTVSIIVSTIFAELVRHGKLQCNLIRDLLYIIIDTLFVHSGLLS